MPFYCCRFEHGSRNIVRLAVVIGAAAALIGAAGTSSLSLPSHAAVQKGAAPAEPATGLQKPWPKMAAPSGNVTTPAKIELGRLLFYDAVLSNNNSISCAHCHHPDLGFSDGLKRAIGYGGEGAGRKREGGIVLLRRTPTLWNTGYSQRLFWDGRAKDLEEQCRFPITEEDEMKQDPDTLVAELRQIPEYAARFDRTFGGARGSGVTFENVTRAIAAFERTLVTSSSRFDRFAAGDDVALNTPEKRGLKLFLSTKARCSECHGLPTFANADFKVLGVADVPGLPADPRHERAEPGRGGGPNGAFRIPTLRNVALKAPYMHNGSLKTLSDVLEFYAKGGGRGHGLNVPLQDDKVRKYRLSGREKADIIVFLESLTDVSTLPGVPSKVPSGLPVVTRILTVAGKSPTARSGKVEPVGQRVRATSSRLTRQRPGSRTITVSPGGSIQAAVDLVGRGGTVRVRPGTYRESVLVIHHDVKLEGMVEQGVRPLLDGGGAHSDAVIALGNRFSISGFMIQNYEGNGVVIRGGRDVSMRDLVVNDPGDYGVYPVECDGVTVENCRVSGAKDAGIYVGQSRRIVVRGNEVLNNVAGIEIENSVDALVEKNHVHDNTGGILVFILPYNISKEGRDCRVVGNRVERNNTPNFAAPGAIVSNVLQGTGIMVLAADKTEVANNRISDNGSLGIALVGLGMVYPKGTRYDVDPMPDDTWIHDNTLSGNGKAPDPRLKQFSVPPGDLLWDFSGQRNRWSQPGATSYPTRLPGPSTSTR